jgi:hypothetical protein
LTDTSPIISIVDALVIKTAKGKPISRQFTNKGGHMNDTLIISLLRGRVGAAVLAIVAAALGSYGITLSDANQAEIINAVAVLVSIGSGVFAAWSKAREGKK